MKSLRIGVDFDGTLAESNQVVLDIVNLKHATNYTLYDVDSWNWWDKNGYSNTFWKVFDLFDSTYLRRAIQPTSVFAVPTIKHLIGLGHHVEIITGNREAAKPSIQSWLFMHGLSDVPVNVLGREGANRKLDLPFDILIDDAPKVALAAKDHPEKRIILYSRPWNKNVSAYEHPNVFVRGEWDEIRSLIKSFAYA